MFRLLLLVPGAICSIAITASSPNGSAAETVPILAPIHFHALYCTARGNKNIFITDVESQRHPVWQLIGSDPSDFLIKVEPGYYDVTLSEGRCQTVSSLRLVVLQDAPRNVAVTLLAEPGKELRGEFTVYDVVRADSGAVAGSLPLDGLNLCLEGKDGSWCAWVENNRYYVDSVPPGNYDLKVRWINWNADLGTVFVTKDSLTLKDITAEELRQHIPMRLIQHTPH